MKYVRKAAVKHVLTEQKRDELCLSFQQEVDQLKKEWQQLEFQMQRALRNAPSSSSAPFEKKYAEERKRRQEKVESLQFKIDQLRLLPTGTELQVETANILMDLAVGERWVEEDAPLSIIVKDGLIKEIREGG